MAIKTFTTGEVLTASDTNTYLANSGLVYITQVALTGATVQVSDVFSSTYDNYRLVMSGASCVSGARNIHMFFGPSSIGGYNSSFYSSRLDVAGSTVSGASDSNIAYWNLSLTVFQSTAAGGVVDIYNPNNATQASFSAQGTDPRTAGGAYLRAAGGMHDQINQYTQLNFVCGGDSFDLGTLFIYGYRKS
jgi:hypothetical protein